MAQATLWTRHAAALLGQSGSDSLHLTPFYFMLGLLGVFAILVISMGIYHARNPNTNDANARNDPNEALLFIGGLVLGLIVSALPFAAFAALIATGVLDDWSPHVGIVLSFVLIRSVARTCERDESSVGMYSGFGVFFVGGLIALFVYG